MARVGGSDCHLLAADSRTTGGRVSMDMKNFVQERDAALLSLDEKRIKTYCQAWGVPIPNSNEVFWRAVHKAVCNITSASTEQRRRSAQWLVEHGSTPEI